MLQKCISRSNNHAQTFELICIYIFFLEQLLHKFQFTVKSDGLKKQSESETEIGGDSGETGDDTGGGEVMFVVLEGGDNGGSGGKTVSLSDLTFNIYCTALDLNTLHFVVFS